MRREILLKVFVAGATGAIGPRLLPALVAEGHEVTGSSRTKAGAHGVSAIGGSGVVLDALDPNAVLDAVGNANPDLVMHQLTSIESVDLENFDRDFSATNRLRTDALDNLLAAAQSVGAQRFIAQSFTGWPNEQIGSDVKTESDRLDQDPAPEAQRSLRAIVHLETELANAQGIEALALRYGQFYRPVTAFGPTGEIYEAIRCRGLPIVSGGAGIWSFVPIDDAVAATIAALENGWSGLYNIVDDHPAPAAEWIAELAGIIGAKTPRRVPSFIARQSIGIQGVRFMTDIRGSSDAKAKRLLGWTPTYATWMDGFRAGL